MLCSQKEGMLQELGKREWGKKKEGKFFVSMDQEQTFWVEGGHKGFFFRPEDYWFLR